jgi:hypothetical protein
MDARNGEALDSAKSKASKDTKPHCYEQQGELTPRPIAAAIGGTATAKSPDILAAALDSLSRGLDVMPLEPRRKWPKAKEWQKARPKSAEDLRRHWASVPDANYGIRTGRLIGDGRHGYLAVVDVDATCEASRIEALAAAREWLGDLDAYPTAATGSGFGLHVFTRTMNPEKSCTPRQAGETVMFHGERKQRWQLELKGAGSQVVGPGSVHPKTGRAYA